ncbi:MAG TPA: hypothetical protein DHV26_03070 [Cytophagales bacterium]|nr:hypothetical protein [Cytophagales bacterium]HRG07024.1 hypothetical protein [Cyclobacteriaceae bacterium]
MSFLERLISFWLEGIAAIVGFLALVFYWWKLGIVRKYNHVIFFTGVVAIIATEISLNTGVTNSFQYSCIYLLNSICWGAFYYKVFNSRLKKNLAIGIASTTSIYFLYKNLFQDFDIIFDSVGQAISSFGIVLLVFIFFYQTLSEIKTGSLTSNFDFWLSSSQLVYHLGAFGIFLTFNHFTNKIFNTQHYSSENREILTYLWGVHNVLLFLASLLTWAGVLWIVYRRKSTSS